ncbi:uncharacterized protein METZ01_LOCUS466160, partial [marine metagenome]
MCSKNGSDQIIIKGKENIDWFIFFTTVLIILSLCIPLIVAPELTNLTLNNAYDYVATNL